MRKTHFAGIMSPGHSQDSYKGSRGNKGRQAPMKQEGIEVRHEGREREFGCNGNDREANSQKLRL